MPCTRPLQAFRDDNFDITFSINDSVNTGPSSWKTVKDINGKVFTFEVFENAILLPCGNCISCRIRRSREWAARCVNEAHCWKHNSFITLTYDNIHLPSSGSLVRSDMQKFIKRLRKRFGNGIRFYYCGEYGEQTNRPHYHALLFNCDFNDKKFFKSRMGYKIYTSDVLKSLWPFGHSSIGSVSFESAAYVSRYCMKKLNGKNSELHYDGRLKEFGQASLKPGLGSLYFDKFFSDIYPSDELVIMKPEFGVYKMKPPRYYDKLLKKFYPDMYIQVMSNREDFYLNNVYDPQSLVNSEKVLTSKLKTLSRVLDFNY